MEVDPPIGSCPETEDTTPYKRGSKKGAKEIPHPKGKVVAAEQELRKFPAVRPPLKGIPKIIEDRPPTNKERERINEVIGNLKRIRKEDRREQYNNPNWGKMELFSTSEKGPLTTHKNSAESRERATGNKNAGGKDRGKGTLRAHLRGEKPENHDSQEQEPKGGTQTPVKRTTTPRNEKKKEKRREKRRMEASKQTKTRDTPPQKGPHLPTTPIPTTRTDTLWTQVLGRKERRRTGEEGGPAPGTRSGKADRRTGQQTHQLSPQQEKRENQKKPTTLKKLPRTAAVQITCPEGEAAKTMKLARERIKLEELGVRELRPRRARTGALLLEIPGADSNKLADTLAAKMREVLADEPGVVISRPVKTVEVRIRDIEDSISAEEIAAGVASAGECEPTELRLGPIRRAPNGLGTVWVRCPLAAAKNISKSGSITIGWTRARVEALPERPMQCYKCMQKGHVRAVCSNTEDHSNKCYRCGVEGHRARECTALPKCILCEGAGRPANHRIGGPACPIPRGGNRRKETASGKKPNVATRTNNSRSAVQAGNNEMEIEEMEITPLPPRRTKANNITTRLRKRKGGRRGDRDGKNHCPPGNRPK